MLILLISFFSNTAAFGQSPGGKAAQSTEQKEEPAKETENKETAAATVDVNTATDINSIADVNAFTDPNAVRARILGFRGLGVDLLQLNRESGDEIREWTRGRLDDRLELALAMQKQVTAEFNFLRELAVKEKALETATAIDGILLDRQERFKDVIEELERNNERLRRIEERRNQERSRERTPRRERPIRRDTQY
jgi:hypothetical protein